jgi:hypothetical protein
MISKAEPDPEVLWESILSENPLRIRSAWDSLEDVERQAVLRHLREMADGEGWQPLQRRSAEKALAVLAPQ